MANLRDERPEPLSKPLPVTGFPVPLSLYGPAGVARRARGLARRMPRARQARHAKAAVPIRICDIFWRHCGDNAVDHCPCHHKTR